MRAAVCKEYGSPPGSVVVDEVDAPTAGPGQVVVDVAACGVNYPDVLMLEDKYQFKPGLPFTPGGEIAGTVSALGDGVTGLAVGDRVAAVCGWGGMAEQVAVGAGAVVPVPDGVDLTVAAGFLTTYGTSHYALADRAQLQPGETLLVLGAAGGVGTATIELGKKMGARVIAAASTDEKLALCREVGADEVVNYGSGDLRAQLKELVPQGVDVCYDPVGGDLAEKAVRSMAWGGRFLVIGFAAGDIPRIPLNLTLLKSCSIVGVFWGAFTGREPERNRANLDEILGWLAAGDLRPHISSTHPLTAAGDAVAELAERRATGKVVVTTG